MLGDLAHQESPENSSNTGDRDGEHGAHDAVGLIPVSRSATLRHAEYQFYRALMFVFLETGGPPDPTTLRALAEHYAIPLEATLADMARQDLVQCDPTSGAIRAAYPFSGVPTTHRVTLLADANGDAPIEIYAMCALDALGIPLMLRRDALVTSVDALTGETVCVRVRRIPTVEVSATGENTIGDLDGWVAVWEPSTAVVFARPEEHECEGGVAAGSCCPMTNFFVTREQAEGWAAAHGSTEDVVLSQDEALQRAHTLFAGALDRISEGTSR